MSQYNRNWSPSLILVAAHLGLVGLVSPAFAQSTKQVEVVNDPLAVEVVNPPVPASPSRFQLVGFTAGALLGNAGALGLTLACQQEFVESRMCSTIEVIETVTVPTALVGQAWVRPSYSPYQHHVSGAFALDASGIVDSPKQLSCVDGQGLTVDTTGRFSLQFCNVPRPIACCALVP